MAYNSKLGEILEWMGYENLVDYEVWDDGDGPYIAVWNVMEPFDGSPNCKQVPIEGSPVGSPPYTIGSPCIETFGSPPMVPAPQPTEQEVNDFYTAYLAGSEYVDSLKPQARYAIDYAAEMARLRYITNGAGQALVYQEKAEEAADYIAAGYPAMGSPPEYPFVHADSIAYGITHQEAADQIIALRAQWIAVGSQVEQIRLGGKKAVNDATDETGVNTARDDAVALLEAL